MAIVDSERWLAGMSFLDPVAERCQKLIGGWLERSGGRGRTAKDALNGVWAGHPVHPPLTGVPMGAWTAAVVLDLAGQRRAADVALATGCGVGAVAAAAGIADWQDSYGMERRTGAAHGLLNLTALGLLSSSLCLRLAGRRGAARPLQLIGLATAATAGYLGGELVFRLGAQVNRNAFTEGPSRWQPAAPEAELGEGTMISRRVGEAEVLLALVDGRICAVAGVCSHAGGPLGEGRLEGGLVTCPWHGSRFDLRSGRVLQGPATAPLPRYQTRVSEAGEIEVRAG